MGYSKKKGKNITHLKIKSLILYQSYVIPKKYNHS